MNQPVKSNTITPKHKGKVFVIALLFVIFIVTILLFGILYLSLNKKPVQEEEQDTTDQTTTENEDDNTIDLENEETKKYKFAAIKKDDTIALYTEAGEEIIINLTKKNWKNILWSENGDYLSVLGKVENTEIYDIYVYDFSKDQWIRVTNFIDFPTGVLSYVWRGKSKLFFNQGIVPDNWLHSYDYINQAEVLKIDRIDGQIIKKSPDENYIIYRLNNSNQLKIFDFQGDEIWDLQDIKDENGKDLANFANIYFTKDETKVILETSDEQNKKHLYKVIIGETEAVEITLDYEFAPVCAVNEDVVSGYTIEKDFNVVSIINYNIKTGEEILRAQKDFDDDLQISLETFECLNKNNVLFRIDDAEESSWYSISNNDELEKFTFLNEAKEIESK